MFGMIILYLCQAQALYEKTFFTTSIVCFRVSTEGTGYAL